MDQPVSKVLMVAPAMEPRGTSEHALNLAGGLSELGVRVAIFCAPGPALSALGRDDVQVETFDHIENLRLRWRERARLVRAAEDFGPQIVHGQSHKVAGALDALRRETGPPLVLTAHWVPARRRGLRRLAGRLAGVIATTEAVREGLVNQCAMGRRKVLVIPNGIDVARLLAGPVTPIFRSRRLVVGSLGPVEEGRGHELFVRAAALVGRQHADVQFLVAGEGGELPELRRLIGDLGMDASMTLATDFSIYEDVLNALDIVVQSSLVDVSGMSILTAMAYGRPVIAFNTGTACEIIEDGRTGVLVPKGDLKALAAAMEMLVAEPDTARRIGEAASRAVKEKFDIRSIARRTLEYYQELLAGGEQDPAHGDGA
jgi:glycosyltransferase involved in cell wall biosynthesis